MDRPIPEERVHPAAVIGHERNVRPFAVPPAGTAPAYANGGHITLPADLLIDPVADGGERLTAGIHILFPLRQVAVVVPVGARVAAVEATPGRRHRVLIVHDIAFRVYGGQLGGLFGDHYGVAQPVRDRAELDPAERRHDDPAPGGHA